jgi:copper chaperone
MMKQAINQFNRGAISMESKTFKVPNMTCNGCVSTVKGELEQLTGVVNVDVNKPAQLVTVEFNNPASWQAIESALVAIDYPPVLEA